MSESNMSIVLAAGSLPSESSVGRFRYLMARGTILPEKPAPYFPFLAWAQQ
jgi:hypothetical protein